MPSETMLKVMRLAWQKKAESLATEATKLCDQMEKAGEGQYLGYAESAEHILFMLVDVLKEDGNEE